MNFEKATREKLRFQTSKGLLSVEDLWDLRLTALNSLAKNLKKQLDESAEEDFLDEVAEEDETIRLQFDVVLHILKTKKKEKKEREELTDKRSEKSKLLAILAEKENEELRNLSPDELRKKIDSLN